jgi:alpha-D-xyloside xylohydrolase
VPATKATVRLATKSIIASGIFADFAAAGVCRSIPGLIREQLELRERLRPYIMDQMAVASATGLPPMRALFLEFPDEEPAWEIGDEYMLGPDVLVAPVCKRGAREREVYLPQGAAWVDAWTGRPVQGNGWVTAMAPLARIPVYLRRGGALEVLSARADR